mmetsp:Transcript_35498/g.65685  ORF Transcript_35498/g.65685 Transcript_35498/m.65685 type:complete len:637 (-) Transcript_35498:58-1968(-)
MDSICHMQSEEKRRHSSRRRPSSSIIATILWHQLLGMKSITVAAGGPIMFARRQPRKPLHYRYPHSGLTEFCRAAVGRISGIAFASPARSTSSTYRSYDITERYVSCSSCAPSQIMRSNITSRERCKQEYMKCFTRNFSTPLFLKRGETTTEINERNWQSFSDELNETLELPAISVPAQHVHWLLSNKDSPVKPFLATGMAELEGVHPKIKIVRDCNGRPDGDTEKVYHDGQKPQRRKRILLDSNVALGENSKEGNSLRHSSTDRLSELTQQLPGVPESVLQRLVEEFEVTYGEPEFIDVLYQNQPITRILSKVLPPEAQPPPSSYEQIGHVAHFNLRQTHIPHGKLIGRVLLDRLQPSIRTVVNKLGEVGGPYRTYQMDLLAGEDDYFVRVIEHGVSLFFDLRNVYWCTRLEGERTYMIENEFKPNQLVADAFCGVGALCIRAAAAKGCRVLANDLNPDAVTYCEDSAKRNGIDVGENGKFQVQCGDASQFIMNLGIDMSDSSSAEDTGVSNLPDHLLLNFPLDSPSFLNALRWWPSGENNIESPPRVHVYTFARGDEVRTAAEVAIDMVADGLLPEGGYVEPSKFRGEYLNEELGCNIEAREIRDAAPGKLVICVSFSVTPVLLRRMQGDYGLD